MGWDALRCGLKSVMESQDPLQSGLLSLDHY